MVLGGGQGHHGLAVGEGQERALGALQHLLHDHGGASGAKVAREALVHALQGLLGGLGHDHALARGQAVGLDYHGAAHLAHVGGAGLLLGKGAIGRRGHARARHDLLGELLGALHLGRLGAGAKAGDAGRAHGVGNALHERGLRAYDHEADAVVLCKGRHGLRGVLVHVGPLGEGVHAAVARRHIEPARARRGRQLGKKRVLASARAQKQDVYLVTHRRSSRCHKSVSHFCDIS